MSSPAQKLLLFKGRFPPTSVHLLKNGSFEATDGSGASIVISPDKFVLLSHGAVLIAQRHAFSEADRDQVSPIPQPVLPEAALAVDLLWRGVSLLELVAGLAS